MKPFKDKFLQKLAAEAIAPLELECGLSFSNLIELADGQVTLAISQNGWDGNSARLPSFVFLIEAKDKSSQLTTNLIELKKKWLDSGRTIKANKIRDVEFTVLTSSPRGATNPIDQATQKTKPSQTSEWLLGQADTLLMLGNSTNVMEQTLARLAAGFASTNLARQNDSASNNAALYRDSLAFGWVNVKRMVEVQAQKVGVTATNGDQLMPRPEKLLSASGFSEADSLSFSWRETGNGSTMEFFLSVPEANRKGIFKILAAEARESSPPPFVPADVVRFTRWRLDFQKAWSNLEKMLLEIFPQAAKDKDPDFDLEKSLIRNLGDDLIFLNRKPGGNTNSERKPFASIVLVGSRNAEQLAASLREISFILPADPAASRERQAQGRKIHSLTLPEVSLTEGVKPSASSLSFAVVSNYLAFSSEPAVLEEFLRHCESTNNSLRELPAFAEAAQRLAGTNTGLFGFADQRETVKGDWEKLRQHPEVFPELFGVFAVAKRLGLGEEITKPQRWFDFSLLPACESVAKYFYITVYSSSVTTDGFSFKVFAPSSPGISK